MRWKSFEIECECGAAVGLSAALADVDNAAFCDVVSFGVWVAVPAHLELEVRCGNGGNGGNGGAGALFSG